MPLRVAGPTAPAGAATASGPAATGPADLPATGSGARVAGAEVSAVVREGDGLVVRVFNPPPRAGRRASPGRRGWLVDLRGRPWRPSRGRSPCGPAASPRWR